MEYAAVSAFIYITLVADGNVFLPIDLWLTCRERQALACYSPIAEFSRKMTRNLLLKGLNSSKLDA